MNFQYENQPPTEDSDVRAMRRQLLLSWLLMVAIVALLAFPVIRSWLSGRRPLAEPRPITPRGALADFETTTVDLFKETSPAVVFITTESRRRSAWSYRTQVERGSGSGFVWDTDGHIVTNYHVIEGARSAEVRFADQSSYRATLVGSSADHDLAVLQIDAPDDQLRPLPIGSSNDLEVGQSVFAIGNPFGLEQTLTTGIVSAKSRTIRSPSDRVIEDVIQVDAAINPGNSGGPLLDSAGRLIGVNTAIYSPSGASAGVGFSIPVDTVNLVVPQLITQGNYAAPKLGIETSDGLNQRLAFEFGIQGVVVISVEPGSAAERAGLRDLQSQGNQRSFDVLLAIDGNRVGSAADIYAALQNKRAGDEVSLVVLRDGEEITLSAQL